jgi:hypothetical protein
MNDVVDDRRVLRSKVDLGKDAALDIDEFLGPSSQRYFGSGYQRVGHNVRELTFGPEGSIRATGEVVYPDDWSCRGNTAALVPHLSSIDCISIAALICEADLAHTARLDARDRRRAWIRGLRFRAGPSVVTDLHAIPVSARLEKVTGGTVRSACRSYSVRLASIKLALDVEYDGADGAACLGRQSYLEIGDLLGPVDSLSYVEGYKQDHLLTEVTISGADVACRVSPAFRYVPCEGMEAFYRPGSAIIDWLVTGAQLAQVMLFGIDKVHRKHAGTMLLRKLDCRSFSPYMAARKPFSAKVTGDSSAVITRGDKQVRVLDGRLAALTVAGTFSISRDAELDQ